MALSDLQVFSEKVYTTKQELLDYNMDLFNQSTRGGLVLVPGSMQGDFYTESLWARIGNLVRRRNAYGSGSLTTQQLSMKVGTKVKVAAGTNPVNLEKNMLSWIQKSVDEASAVVAKQLAQDEMNDLLSTAIKAYVAAVGNVSTNVYDGTAGTPDFTKLVNAAQLMGDRYEDIVCWLMHSKSFFDIHKIGLANASQLFKFGTVMVMADSLGKPFVVADHPALVYTSTGTKYRVLGLTPGAVQIEQNNDFNSNVDTRNGNENIATTWQAEWTFNIGLKGFTWDMTNGGASPNDAALTTATNWDVVAASNRDLAGVLANFQ